jgi:uncharacterized membrane protein YccF (DUF307 family)
MKVLGNIIWLILAGIWLFIVYLIAGILNCVTVIGIPFGIQAFKIAGFVIWPFGRTVADRPGASALKSGCGNIIWFVLGGWYTALTHFITGILLCIPVITIPLAVQNFKLAGLALAPFGKEIVSNAEAQRRRDAVKAYVDSAAAPSATPRGDDVAF